MKLYNLFYNRSKTVFLHEDVVNDQLNINLQNVFKP